ncbi:MAG: signal peptidase I [Actinomycetota bacterium]|nr:signal peptidase I [Actinomycetota bacterium]
MDSASAATTSPGRRALRFRARRLAALALPLAALALAGLVLVPALLGYERYVITSGSMSGSIDTGSLVLAEEVPVAALRAGDVITYVPPAGGRAGERVTHRIVSIGRDAHGRRVFRTKGDANRTADPWRFTLDSPTQARAKLDVPYVGYALAALADRRLRMLLIGLPALLIALAVLAGLWREAGRARSLVVTSAFAALALGGVAFSAAGFAATTASPGNSFSAAPDWTPPSASLDDPGSTLRASVSLTATASDATSGVAAVKVQRRPAGATSWTDVCSDTSAPYACTLDTAAGATPDGLYELRALATDGAGNEAGSVVRSVRIDNTAPSASLNLPAGGLSGTATLASVTGDGAGSGVASVRYEYVPSGGTGWIHACTSSSAPFSCSFATHVGDTPDGRYDFRAIARDAAGNSTTSATVANLWIDNAAPTSVTMQDPGSPLTGTRTFSGGASDAGSGVASVKFQYRPSGGSAWSDACSATASPYSCAFNTAALADGLYDLRALATDGAGNATASAAVTSRRLDNQGPTVSLTLPGTHFGGTVSFNATASDGQGTGVASVKVQYRATGTSSWTDMCTDNTAPYSCSLNTKAELNGVRITPDGGYEFRAIATDNVALSTTTAAQTGVIDNQAPAGADVQAFNAAAKPGVIEPADRVELTYTETMKPDSILAGWNGAATAVTVRFLDAVGGDHIEVYDAANSVKLALISSNRTIKLVGDYVPASGATFSATMAQSGAKVTITLNTLTAGGVNATAPPASTMEWGPSTAATDLAGNGCSASAVFELILETGVVDVEF